ncbi:hypothetical protein CAPTEDRAFT_78744, partial [Capitella teleta]
PTDSPVDILVGFYNATTESMLDLHAPTKTRRVPVRFNPEWYSLEVRTTKQKMRQLERLWRRTKLTVHKEMYLEAKKEVSLTIRMAKKTHYQGLIDLNKNDPLPTDLLLNCLDQLL